MTDFESVDTPAFIYYEAQIARDLASAREAVRDDGTHLLFALKSFSIVGGVQLPELVVSRENGWLIPAGSVDDIVEALREVLETPPETLLRMGMTGREHVLAVHDARKSAGILAGLFAGDAA